MIGRILAGILFLALAACDPLPGNPPAKADPRLKPDSAAGLLEAVLARPERFASEAVTVTGTFRGWRGPCQGGPPVSRSDWMLTASAGCLYVHGPLPRGLDPGDPGDETVSVTGVVRLHQGRPYLEAGRSTVLPSRGKAFPD